MLVSVVGQIVIQRGGLSVGLKLVRDVMANTADGQRLEMAPSAVPRWAGK